MTLKIYNTPKGEKEVFEPLKQGEVSIYVCGMTVYNLCHIGHARSAVVFDIVRREFLRRGFKVNYVKNFTDVDDKIIKKALEENVSAEEISERYIAETIKDMNDLGCLPPTVEPKVTTHIDDIIELIKNLVEKGFAYPSNGDVYYSVEKFSRYGEFSKRNIEDLRAGARVCISEQKKNPLDFALWKANKPGEPFWNSPWGTGRPGWHIECSAMSSKYLGTTFDIHGGGTDLIFPHHENEIAQSEAVTNHTLSNYWMHNGMITVDQEKMSKSLNNFLTIRDCLTRYHFESIRMFLLSNHYRSPVDFSNSSLEEAEVALERLYNAIQMSEKLISKTTSQLPHNLDRFTSSINQQNIVDIFNGLKNNSDFFKNIFDAKLFSTNENDLLNLSRETLNSINTAMDDDFNTAKAIGHLFELSRGIGRFITLTPKGSSYSSLVLNIAKIILQGFSQSVLGILNDTPQNFQNDLNKRRLIGRAITEKDITSFIGQRKEARDTKNWKEADRIRDLLQKEGVLLEDGQSDTIWKVLSRNTSNCFY